jgi:asparagine synthase (glutamine-hydrolysing)
MCGIAGALGEGALDSVPGMLDRLCHRGPDDDGLHRDGPIAIGMRRLAIIDLSGGHQPMASEDGRIWVIQNGEIFNYIELRSELIQRGHRFRTDSDTEVMIHLYEDHGPDFVNHLRGMFALALWDSTRKRLILARDRLGKKPLYHASTTEGLVFASEIKAIVGTGLVPREIDPTALYQYLCFGFVPHPRTIYRGIQMLPPAHRMLIDDGAEPRIERYWHLPGPSANPPSREEAVARTEELIQESVELRLRSDVPVGIFLSGGIDSGLVTAAAARATGHPLRTFSVGFDNAAFDERPHARLVADRYGTNHTEIFVDLAAEVRDPEALMDRLVGAYDQPYADSSAIPSMAVSREARKHVTVVLNGDGGDEAFAGYRRYSAALLADWTTTALGPMAATAARLAPAPRQRRGAVGFALRLVEGVGLPPRDRYIRWSGLLTDGDARALAQPWFLRDVDESAGALVKKRVDACHSWGIHEPAALMMATDTTHVLPDDLLVKMDIATMAASVEGRSPFLDHVLVEFAAGLPDRIRASAFQTKPILRAVARSWLPPEIVNAPKRGFEVPMASWLRNELRPYAEARLLDERSPLREWVQPAAVKRQWTEHSTEQRDHAMRLWSLLFLDRWLTRSERS